MKYIFHSTMSLEGNVYYHRYFDAEFQIVAEEDGDYIGVWLDREDDGFRRSKENCPTDEWELVEES